MRIRGYFRNNKIRMRELENKLKDFFLLEKKYNSKSVWFMEKLYKNRLANEKQEEPFKIIFYGAWYDFFKRDLSTDWFKDILTTIIKVVWVPKTKKSLYNIIKCKTANLNGANTFVDSI